MPTSPRSSCSGRAGCPSWRTTSRSWSRRARRPGACGSWWGPPRRWPAPSSCSCASRPPRPMTAPPTCPTSRRWPGRSPPTWRPDSIIVNKSTVPVGSTLVVERVLGRHDVTVVSNPEFLREGTAVPDSLHPERIVVGAADQAAAARVGELFAGTHAPLLITDAATAETIKYASNAFLATKLSFVNAVAGTLRGGGGGRPGRDPRARLRQADRVRVPPPRSRLGRKLPAQGHPGAGLHRRAGRLRLLLPAGSHRHQRRAVRPGGGQGRPGAVPYRPGARRRRSRGRRRRAVRVGGGGLGPHLQGRHRRPPQLAGRRGGAADGAGPGRPSRPSTRR